MSATARLMTIDSSPAPMAVPTLGQFVTAAEASEGVWLSSLAAIDQLEVRTRNTLYRITLLGGGRVLVLGGSYFPVWSEAFLAGSTLGGSCLKMAWLGRGFSMEFLHEGQRIVTTHVQEIRTQVPPASRPS